MLLIRCVSNHFMASLARLGPQDVAGLGEAEQNLPHGDEACV